MPRRIYITGVAPAQRERVLQASTPTNAPRLATDADTAQDAQRSTHARTLPRSPMATLRRRASTVVRTKRVTFNLSSTLDRATGASDRDRDASVQSHAALGTVVRRRASTFPLASSNSDDDRAHANDDGNEEAEDANDGDDDVTPVPSATLPRRPKMTRMQTADSARTFASGATGASFHTAYEQPEDIKAAEREAQDESDDDDDNDDEPDVTAPLVAVAGSETPGGEQGTPVSATEPMPPILQPTPVRSSPPASANSPIRRRPTSPRNASRVSFRRRWCGPPFSRCMRRSRSRPRADAAIVVFQSLVLVREQHTTLQLVRRSLDHQNEFWKEYMAFLTVRQAGAGFVGKELILCSPKATSPKWPKLRLPLDQPRMRLRIQYPLDFSFSLRDVQSPNMHILHCASTELSMLWYSALYAVLPAASRPAFPEFIEVHAPDLHLRVRIPLSMTPVLTVWDVKRLALDEIDKYHLTDEHSVRWRASDLCMCWRRGERLEWITHGDTGINASMLSSRVIEGTHVLEIRPAATLLRKVLITANHVLDPPQAFEGYLYKRRYATVMSDTFEVRYFSTHSHFLFYSKARYALPHQVAASSSSSDGQEEDTDFFTEYEIGDGRWRNETHVLNAKGFINLLEVETIEVPGACSECAHTLGDFLGVGVAMPHTRRRTQSTTATATAAATAVGSSTAEEQAPLTLPLIMFSTPGAGANKHPDGSLTIAHDFILHTAVGRVHLRTDRHDQVHAWVRLLASAIRYYRWHHHEMLVEENSMMKRNRGVAELCLNNEEVLQNMRASPRLWGSIPDEDVVKLSTPLYTKPNAAHKSFHPGFHILTRTHVLRYLVSLKSHAYKLDASMALSNRSHVLSGYVDPRTGQPLTSKRARAVKLFPAQGAGLDTADPTATDESVGGGAATPWHDMMSQMRGYHGPIEEEELVFDADDDEDDEEEEEEEAEDEEMALRRAFVTASRYQNSAALQVELRRNGRTMTEQLPSLVDTFVTSSEDVTEITFSLWSPPRTLQWFKRMQQRGRMAVLRSRWKLEKQMWMVCMQMCINAIVADTVEVGQGEGTTTARQEMQALVQRIAELVGGGDAAE
ncbi:hypothetical protein RI367_003587 [Sorochytrium milnesiophthora]